MQHFFDSQLFLWLQKYQDILFPISIIISVLAWLTNFVVKNAKIFEYFFFLKAKRLNRKIELLKISNNFNEFFVSDIIENQIKDELFIKSTGITFRGTKRVLFIKLFKNLKGQFDLTQFRIIQSYIIQSGDELKIVSLWRILTELLFFVIIYLFVAALFALLLIISFNSNYEVWIKLFLFAFLTLDIVLIAFQYRKLIIILKLRQKLK